MIKKLFLTLILIIITLASFSQALSNDTLHWSDYKKLTWNDFKGEPIELPGMSGQTLIVMSANFHKAHLFLPTSALVVNVFDRKNSWVVNQAKSDQYLKYYQLEFDVYEVYTRKLRKEYKQIKFGLDPNKAFQEKYNQALTSLSERNKQLMKETKMGQDIEAINRWAETIRLELGELDEYRQKK